MRSNHINSIDYRTIRTHILTFSCVVAAIFGICASATAEYCASGDVDVSIYWNLSQGIVSESYEVKCTAGELSIDLSEELTGPDGNTAGAQSIASLPVAWQTAYGSGITPDIDAGSASGDATNQLKDRLTFTVPAGYFAQDVVVGLRGRVSGTFTMTGGGSGRATYNACFVAGNCVDWEWEDEDGWAFSGNYYLSYRLVAAGTTLTEPRIRTCALGSRLSIRGQSYGSQENSGTSEISSALHILSSHDIAWTSESGAFCSAPLSQGDNNFDGDVDGSDLAEFIFDFARNDCAGDCDADFDFDGNVDNSDLGVFAFEFGTMD
jgi:hypothetical protein